MESYDIMYSHLHLFLTKQFNSEQLYLLLILIIVSRLKGRVQCILIQVVMNKCFLLNPKKEFVQIRHVVFEKNAHFFRKMTLLR